MRRFSEILLSATLLVFGLGASSCVMSHDEPDLPPEPVEPAKPQSCKLLLSLSMSTDMSTGTRAADGDEINGYGWEQGVRNENKIHNLTLYFYESSDGPNDSGTKTIHHTIYVENPEVKNNGETNKTEGTYRYDVYNREYEVDVDFLPKVTDRVLVVANTGSEKKFGNLSTAMSETAPAWSSNTDIAAYDKFVMASCREDDGVITELNQTSQNGSKFFSTTVTIERLASRIDLWFDEQNIDSNELKYEITASGAQVYITDVLPVNVMQQSTYLFKHLTSDLTKMTTDLKYCSKELMDAEGYPKNYVIEPKTNSKTDKNTVTELTSWYGATRSAAITASSFPSTPLLKTCLGTPTLMQTKTGETHSKVLTISYANENTYPVDAADANHVTGLLLKSIFVPKQDAKPLEEGQTAKPFAKGETFWRVRSFDMDESKSRYFHDEADAKQYVKDNAGYEAPVKYEGGVCYYSVWLKHRTEEKPDVPIFPMEYATVRNHIYRVAFTFRGPGTDTPQFENPEEHVAQIYVRRWDLCQLVPIIM